MHEALLLEEPPVVIEAALPPADAPPRRFRRVRGLLWRSIRGLGSAIGWVFGMVSLILGLSILAALPILQFLSMGYLLESSARVARSGRLRDGVIGVRLAGRVGGTAVGVVASLIPLWLAGLYAGSAAIIDPGGSVERTWRIIRAVVWALTCLHLLAAFARGGRIRHFLWPFGNPLWVYRRLREGGLYAASRDGFWSFVGRLRLPHYFRLGLIGFLGTLAWLVLPSALLASTSRFPLLGIVGAISLAFVAPRLPFLQVRYAVEGRTSALFSFRAVRQGFGRAPWAFAFALAVLLLASVPLYLLKIEMIPREAAWLPSLVFVIFLGPAHLLVGWAYARSRRRDQPRHWFFRILGRLAIVVVALFYVLVVFISQYTSWGGLWSVYEQHAFLLPVPFLTM
ncbi:hypothetical protein [Paludisphaera borealis]|uniref:DUF4013 domain-containing protein n=1 Tax=Paludisphaera borealis TaxID=1387353 RepID=A0A1U7CU38_9BACT|nr:hypothetical protein [Paludisphaera borealis]APW62457.1 hypothetical protein BSF38_04003 [Paludisphaera borealis]